MNIPGVWKGEKWDGILVRGCLLFTWHLEKREAWKHCSSEDLLRMSAGAASLFLLAILLNQGWTDKNNLKTFTSLELWICEMLFLVYKLAELQFVSVLGFWFFFFLIPVLCSWWTLCGVVRSAVPFPFSSLAVHISSCITYSFWSLPSCPPPHSHWGPIPFLPFTRCFKGSDFQHIKLMQKKCVAFTTESFH